MLKIFDANGNAINIESHIVSYDEAAAKTKLTGKVMLTIGDSYSRAMNNRFASIAAKYGMVLDNPSVIGAMIAQKNSATLIASQVTAAVSDYTSGKTISGTTYHASDVEIITFMGGANDGARIEQDIGTGLHTTATNTIYGSLNSMFKSLLGTFTAAKMIVVTQPSNFSGEVSSVDTDEKAQALGFADLTELSAFDDVQYTNYCMAQKETAVKNAAWAYGIPVLDMFHEFPSVFSSVNRTSYWQNDKLHLTTSGYNIVAAAIDKKIAEVSS